MDVALGPDESSESWYANSRSAVATLGVHAISTADPVGIWHIINSRYIDKSGTFSIACYKYLLKQIDLSPFKKIVFFMDCGPHFRSYRVLSSIIMYNASLKLDTSLNYLPECHAKSIIDGFFAKMNGVMQQGALSQMDHDDR